MWYVPENNEIFKIWYSPSEIRSWVKNAADYHGIPQELLAVILQQENGPNATWWQKGGQFLERSLTTASAILDEHLGDIVSDKLAGGSSGIANMSRKTLKDAVKYIEETYYYKKPVLPEDVRYRLLGWDQDTQISGDDLKADLYYSAAHLRQLIDRITGQPCYEGPLTFEQVEKIAAAYNGSGDLAKKYGEDALQRLEDAITGKEPLYFYEK